MKFNSKNIYILVDKDGYLMDAVTNRGLARRHRAKDETIFVIPTKELKKCK